MAAEFVGRGELTEDYFLFENSPLPYVSLWNKFNLQSEYIEYEQMQVMLPQRRQDHLDWIAALEDSIRTGCPFTKARSHRECAFGKWLYSYSTKEMQLSVLLMQLESPHALIHQLADKLLGLADTGKGQEALDALSKAKEGTLTKLLELFDLTDALAEMLQRRIAIIFSHESERYALGADGIKDIVTIPTEQIKKIACDSKNLGSPHLNEILVLKDETIVPLLRAHTFSSI